MLVVAVGVARGGRNERCCAVVLWRLLLRVQEEEEAQEVGSSLSRSAQPPFTAVLWSVLSQPGAACSCVSACVRMFRQAVQPQRHMLLDACVYVCVCVHNVQQ